MRTAAVCPTCSTYENALCVIYNGEYLPNTNIEPLDSIEVALEKIDISISQVNGNGPRPVVTIIGDYTITNNDYCIIYAPSELPQTSPYVTLPSAVDNVGREFLLVNLLINSGNSNFYLQTVLSQKIKFNTTDVSEIETVIGASRWRLISNGTDWIITDY